jgi:predicted acetyltransferase
MYVVDRGEMLTLEEVTGRLAAAYLDMIEDFESDGRGYPYNDADTARQDFSGFARDLRDEALGADCPPGVIPQTTYVLVSDGERVLGGFRFRPTLPPPYNTNNGHVGYNVRPTERGKGYATRGLALLCEKARGLGLDGLSLPVDGENPASVRVIEKNGGMLRGTITDPQSGTVVSWYGIALSTV